MKTERPPPDNRGAAAERGNFKWKKFVKILLV